MPSLLPSRGFITAPAKFAALVLCLLFAVSLPSPADDEPFTFSRVPLLRINTVTGEAPTYTVVYPPDGSSAVTINSEYVGARMTITKDDQTVYDSGEYIKNASGLKMKVRGNSTGAYLTVKPYKLKLMRKADLLQRTDADYRHTDWALLSMITVNTAFPNRQSNLLTFTGLIVNDIVGMDWTPATTVVNLVLNGRYRGMFLLIETVERGESRVNVEDSGYIVENDRHYWNEDVYFRTPKMSSIQGWTFKYPDDDDVTDGVMTKISDFIVDFENALYAEHDDSADDNFDDYIDLSSFARWVLAHDFLGSTDANGSNMFLSKKNFDPANPTSSKLKMCTLWDFDTSFLAADDSWSNLHRYDALYYQELFTHKKFVDAYLAAWDSISPTFMEKVRTAYDSLRNYYGTAFDESIALHKQFSSGDFRRDFGTQVTEQIDHLQSRFNALTLLVDELRDAATGITALTTTSTAQRDVKDLSGRSHGDVELNTLPPGIYIVKDAQGNVTKVKR